MLTMLSSVTDSMKKMSTKGNYSFYKVEIDLHETPQKPIIYFRKCRKCTTAKGADRQHNRIVNETVNDWRQYSQQIRRYTVSRVPADQVDYVWA